MNDYNQVNRIGGAIGEIMIRTISDPDGLDWEDAVFAAGLAINGVFTASMLADPTKTRETQRALALRILVAALNQHIEVIAVPSMPDGPVRLTSAKTSDAIH